MSYPSSSQPEPDGSAPQQRTSVRPPGTVIAAAVLAFILTALQVLGAFNEFVLASQIPNLSPRELSELPTTSSAVFYFFSVLELVVAAFLVWGGVSALRGKTSKILFLTALTLGLLAAVGLAAFGVFSLAGLLLVLAAITIRLLRANSSREFFNSREG